jgi:hypothetical protein
VSAAVVVVMFAGKNCAAATPTRAWVAGLAGHAEHLAPGVMNAVPNVIVAMVADAVGLVPVVTVM